MKRLLTTEESNPASEAIDNLSALELVRLMNSEDSQVAAAVGRQAEQVAAAIEAIADRLRRGGRLIYLGAGTSGRLGVLDATECPPTFSSPPGQVVGLIAGGTQALTRAVEGAEDQPQLAVADLEQIALSANDVVVGIATSGRTPYVVGGLEFAAGRGAFTIALACNEDSSVSGCAGLTITPVVGPEVVSGSTRLKAGTATKMVLNMLSTGAMVLIGKTYGNLMVDLRATNSKLRERAQRIVAELTGVEIKQAAQLLARAGGEVKTAVVVERRGVGPEEARGLLDAAGGQLRGALCAGQAAPDETAADLVLGIDGGGSGTTALLASQSASGDEQILGRGEAGPSNPQAVGFHKATAAIDAAIGQAFQAAGLDRRPVAAACLALAGAARPEQRQEFQRWAGSRRIAGHLIQVHDGWPVLAAGTPEGWGVAVIAGTGSLAFGRGRDGHEARAGGWGHLLGDEGSGYRLAVEALRAVTQAADGRGRATQLCERLLEAIGAAQPEQLIAALHGGQWDRARLALLAGIVTQTAAGGDAVAVELVERSARELASMAAAVARRLGFAGASFPVALAGGLLLGAPLVAERFQTELRELGCHGEPVGLVTEPAVGAVRLCSGWSVVGGQ